MITVCERAIDLLQPLKQYVDAVKAKKCTDPKTKSYSIVSEAVKDTLIQAKLAFFKSVDNQLQPFLTSYQTEIPMISFMYNDLNNLLESMMEQFVKPALMKHLKDTKQVDVNKTDNLCDYTKVDVGFSANRLFRD